MHRELTMNSDFIRIGNVILNLKHVIDVRFYDYAELESEDEERKAPVLYITTSELKNDDFGLKNRTYRFFGEKAERAWHCFTSMAWSV
jgi:hypothetical protein